MAWKVQDRSTPLDFSYTKDTGDALDRLVELTIKWHELADECFYVADDNEESTAGLYLDMEKIEKEKSHLYNNPVIAFLRQYTKTELIVIADILGEEDEEEYAHNEH